MEKTENLKLRFWGCAEGDGSIRVRSHVHDFYQMNVSISGSCLFLTEKGKYQAGEGDLVLIGPGVHHQLKYPGPYFCYSFKFDAYLPDFPGILFIPANDFTRGVIKALRAILDVTFPSRYFGVPEGTVIMPEDDYQVLLEHFLEGVLSMLFRRRERYSAPLAQVCDILESGTGGYLSVKEASAVCGYSRNRFSQIVRRSTGLSAKDFLNRLRMETAERYLRFTSLSIGEISEKMGFSSQFHFSDFFRRVKGVSPLKYRKSRE